jgi:uncharacterized membrane protein YfcA
VDWIVDNLMTIDAAKIFLASVLVGVVVGMTGMGGGALMTPALIFLGINPTAAVANDLTAASVNKSVGASVHWRAGSPNLRLAGLLMIGSVPAAFAGPWIVKGIGAGEDQQAFVKAAIGWALLVTASTYTLRIYLQLRDSAAGRTRGSGQDPVILPVRTILIGAVGGLLVGITSVGSGSVIMLTLLLVYPTLSAVRLVGTDLVQAVPLVLSAAISNIIVHGINWEVLIPLIIGGSPGTFLGSRLAGRVPQSVIRRGIVIVLTLSGLALLQVDPVIVGMVGGALLILGPVMWGLVRASVGLPMFGPRAEFPPDDPLYGEGAVDRR